MGRAREYHIRKKEWVDPIEFLVEISLIKFALNSISLFSKLKICDSLTVVFKFEENNEECSNFRDWKTIIITPHRSSWDRKYESLRYTKFQSDRTAMMGSHRLIMRIPISFSSSLWVIRCFPVYLVFLACILAFTFSSSANLPVVCLISSLRLPFCDHLTL